MDGMAAQCMSGRRQVLGPEGEEMYIPPDHPSERAGERTTQNPFCRCHTLGFSSTARWRSVLCEIIIASREIALVPTLKEPKTGNIR